MAVCGHCEKKVGGIKDHIRDSHGDRFYSMGPDFRYYSYRWLRENMPDQVDTRPHWDATYADPIQVRQAPPPPAGDSPIQNVQQENAPCGPRP